ncbi:MAG: hypothetical protein RMJ03_02815 [Nitrososphaerota archaeon]|nr:hypothetical protein [Nitrososphaerota archaeon]
MISILLVSILATLAPASAQARTVVKVIPTFIEKGPENVIGQTVTVAVVVENVRDLWGFDIKFKWDTTFLDYVSRKVTVPVEDYPAPQPPSPYGGVLHTGPSGPPITVKDTVDTIAGTYHLAKSTLAPASAFNGNGTFFTMTFMIKYQQWDYEGDITFFFDFIDVKLSDSAARPISHEKVKGTFLMHGRRFEYPPLPLLDIRTPEGKTYVADSLNEEFNVDIYLLGADGRALDSFWDIQGFDMYLNFNKTLVNAVTSVIDPEGRFASFWPDGIYIVSNLINNTGGYVRLVFLGLPGTGGAHTAPYGTIKLATIKFKVIYESEVYPPPTFTFTLLNPLDKRPTPKPEWPWNAAFFLVKIAGFPHPERPYHPWDGLPWSPAIPHVVSTATYKAPFKPPGRFIDVYTEYPEPYGGQGPREPSDAFGPQSEVTLYALVTYNFDPVQQKLVTFEIWHGEFHYIRTARTNENGIATISFRLPWPCENPEARVFGTWYVNATVEIAEKYVFDTLTFEVGYLIKILSVEPGAPAFKKGEHMTFKITYKCISEQPLDVVFWVVVYDDLGVTIAYNYVPVKGVTKGTYTVEIGCMELKKWAFVGMGTVYANALTKLPSQGGTAYCPEVSATFGILRA